MSNPKAYHELSQAELAGIIEAIRNPKKESKSYIAKRYKRNKKTLINVAERALEAEKENIDPLTPEACTAKPRPVIPGV